METFLLSLPLLSIPTQAFMFSSIEHLTWGKKRSIPYEPSAWYIPTHYPPPKLSYRQGAKPAHSSLIQNVEMSSHLENIALSTIQSQRPHASRSLKLWLQVITLNSVPLWLTVNVPLTIRGYYQTVIHRDVLVPKTNYIYIPNIRGLRQCFTVLYRIWSTPSWHQHSNSWLLSLSSLDLQHQRRVYKIQVIDTVINPAHPSIPRDLSSPPTTCKTNSALARLLWVPLFAHRYIKLLT
jgi:hypothetical protein